MLRLGALIDMVFHNMRSLEKKMRGNKRSSLSSLSSRNIKAKTTT